ncbi:MAG: iron-sulfur cluster assembly protein [Anaerolineales bacterium]|nr:iron-sulfur cluster assembly protein [Anaerolineales bacterium]
MADPEALRQAIMERLSKVIDPETGVDVVRMRLIEDLTVDQNGRVSYKFRPSSPFCPIAIPLSNEIQQAVAEVEGITEQNLEIVGFALGDELMNMLKQAMKETNPGKDEA